MANLKEIRSRITSVGSTMQITNAMKMVSAAKLKKAQDSIVQLRPYANKLKELLQNVSASLDDANAGGEYTKAREAKKVLLVAISSNRGLCGAFNTNIIKQTNALTKDFNSNGIECQVVTIGKKANDILKKTNTIQSNQSKLWDDLNFANVAEIAKDLTNLFLDGSFDQIHIIYNQFKNAATQYVATEQFLPVELNQNQEATTAMDYIFEPNKEEIITDLIPQSLRTQLYKAVLDSNASEHGARMTAMHKATDNANDLRRELVLQYNKERQAAITKEILEIVGGAEALGG